MKKSELSTELADELDDSSNTDVINLLNTFIDDIISEVIIKYKWKYLNISVELVLNNGSSTLELDGFIDITGIKRVDNDDRIARVNSDLLFRFNEDLDSSGPPEVYYVDSFDQNKQSWLLRFNNIADADYTLMITGLKEIDALNASDHIPFPRPVISIIKNGVRALWYDHEQEPSLANKYESRYERKLEEFMRNYSQITDHDIYSPLNSDLELLNVRRTDWDINLRLDSRRIVEP